MATYNMELRKVCDYYSREEVENWFKSYELSDFLRPDEIQSIQTAGLWNKERLARKIVDHYFMREIGFETPGLFAHYVKVTMQEIMEEKLPLIYSASIKYDPLVNVDFTETFERNVENSNETSSSGNGSSSSVGTDNSSSSGSGSSSSSSSSDSLNITNNTPQKRITAQDLETGAYASSVNQNNTTNEDTTENTTLNESESTSSNTSQNSSSSTSQGSGEETENYTKKVKGNSGVSATAQKMIEQYRQNIVAIDRQIIEELNILFMGLY